MNHLPDNSARRSWQQTAPFQAPLCDRPRPRALWAGSSLVATGASCPFLTRIVRYHIVHVRIIERVLLGVIDLETGWLEWQIKRRELTNEEGES